jgi:NitT/TauT family transport system substrate-binding protein
MRIRKWAMGVLAAAAMMGSALAAGAADLKKVTFASSSFGMLYVPVYTADVMGYFAKEGIEAEIQEIKSGGAGVLAAVLGGDIDIYTGVSGTTLRSVAKGSDMRIFAALMTQYGSNVVLQGETARKLGLTETSPLKDRLAALKGLNIGVTGAGSGSHQLALYLLDRAGLNAEKDATIVFVGAENELLAAFERKRIDAFILSNPTSDIAVMKYGGFLLLDMAGGQVPELDGFLYATLNAREAWLKQDPQRNTGVVRAIKAAQEAIHDPRLGSEARDKVHKRYFGKTDKATFDAAWSRVVKAYPSSPDVKKEKVVEVIEFLNKFSKEHYDPAIAGTAMTNEYVEKAKSAGAN